MVLSLTSLPVTLNICINKPMIPCPSYATTKTSCPLSLNTQNSKSNDVTTSAKVNNRFNRPCLSVREPSFFPLTPELQ